MWNLGCSKLVIFMGNLTIHPGVLWHTSFLGKKHIGDVPVCFARCRFHFNFTEHWQLGHQRVKMKYEEQVSSLRVKGIGPQLSHIHYMTKTEQFSKWTSQRPLLKKKHFPRGTNPCATMIGPQQSVGNTQIWHVSCEHGSQIRFWWPHLLKWIPSGMLPKLKSTRVGSSKWALCTLDRLDCPISEDPLGFPRTKVASNCDKISKALRLWPSKSSSHHKTPWRSKVWCFKCTWVCGTIASNHHGHVDSKLRWYLSLFLCKNYGFPWFYCVCEQVHIINFRHIFSCSYWMLLDSYIRSKGPSLGSASESRQHPQPPAVVTAEAAWS